MSQVVNFETNPDSTVLAYHTARGEVPPHAHKRCHELLYVAGGSGWCVVNREPFPVAQDQLLMLPAGVRHEVRDDPHSPLSVCVLAFKEEALTGFADADALLSPVHVGPKLNVAPLHAKAVYVLMRRLINEALHHPPLWSTASRLYLLEVLLLLTRQRATESRGVDPRVRIIKDLLDNGLMESPDLENLSRIVDLSSRQLTTLFKRDIGMTVSDYATAVRVERAKTLLATTRMDVNSICFEAGFQSVPQFYRAFHRAIGASPGRYREQHHT